MRYWTFRRQRSSALCRMPRIPAREQSMGRRVYFIMRTRAGLATQPAPDAHLAIVTVVPLQEVGAVARKVIRECLAERRERAIFLLDQGDLPRKVGIADAFGAQTWFSRDLARRGREQGNPDPGTHHAERRHHVGGL